MDTTDQLTLSQTGAWGQEPTLEAVPVAGLRPRAPQLTWSGLSPNRARALLIKGGWTQQIQMQGAQ